MPRTLNSFEFFAAKSEARTIVVNGDAILITMATPTLVLAPIPNLSSLKECRPNLMPFHIDYSGPAPIATYLIVEPARETVGAPSPVLSQTTKEEECREEDTDLISDDAKALCSGAVTMETNLKPASGELAVPLSAVHDANSEETPRGDTTVDMQETVRNQQETRVCPENSTKSQFLPTTLASLAKRAADATTRFISSFRGRKIQGLKVELPPGYVGVVLKADERLGEANKPSWKARNNAKGRPAKSKAGGRSTRNSARVIDVDAEEEGNIDDAMDVDNSFVDPGAIRTLVPTSQFSSFILWHADHPVDEGRDEYFRSLTEWTRLAHEVCMPWFPP